MNERRWFLAGAVLVLAACGGSNDTPDSGMTGSDSGGADSGAPATPPVAMADTDGDPSNGSEAMANFGCRGTVTAPAATADVEYTAHFYDFQTPTTNVADAPIEIFPDNLVAADCSGTCVSATTDASGDATVTTPGSAWIAYRVPATGSYVATIGYNRAAPDAPGATLGLPVVSQTTLNFIPTLFSRMRLPGTGVVSGNLSDCDGNSVEGAQLHLFRGDTEIQPGTGSTDFFVGYFNSATGLPSRTARWTDADGIYASANVEATTELVRVELWAVLTEGGEPERVACEAIQVAGNAVSIISVGPERSDYPTGHPCAM